MRAYRTKKNPDNPTNQSLWNDFTGLYTEFRKQLIILVLWLLKIIGMKKSPID